MDLPQDSSSSVSTFLGLLLPAHPFFTSYFSVFTKNKSCFIVQYFKIISIHYHEECYIFLYYIFNIKLWNFFFTSFVLYLYFKSSTQKIHILFTLYNLSCYIYSTLLYLFNYFFAHYLFTLIFILFSSKHVSYLII